MLRGETDLAARRSDEARALCRERGFKFFGAIAAILSGWASTLAGNDPVAGIEAMETGLASYTSTGARMMLAFLHGLLAEAYEHAGRPADARSALENALAELDPGGSFYQDVLNRLQTALAPITTIPPSPMAAASLTPGCRFGPGDDDEARYTS